MNRRSELQTDARRDSRSLSGYCAGPRAGGLRAHAASREVTIAVALLPLLLVVACGSHGDAGLGPDEGPGHPMVGTVAPQFAAQDPSGAWLPLANLKAKPVALLFVRPGGPLALDLAREMSRLRDDPRFRGIVFLGIVRSSLENAREFREGNGFSLAILRDPGSITSSYDAGNLPTVVLMDPDHIVRFRLDGFTARKYRPGLEAMVAALTVLPGQSREIGRPLELTYTEYPGTPMFESGVAHVGADACRACHQSEYDQWVRSPHAGAFALVLAVNRSADPECVKCHVTAAGLPGGFGDDDAPGPMTNVQCEVCHGPGADHVEAPADLKSATIYGITNQRSFRIIQGVCTTCHDQRNDPDFDIEAALPLVSH